MKLSPIFPAVVQTFYNRGLFKEIYTRWGAGRIVLLIMAALLIGSVPMFLKMQLEFTGFMSKHVNSMISEFPDLKISQGKVSFSGTLPYVKTLDPSFTIIIDTSGMYEIKNAQPGQLILTNGWLGMKKSSGEIRQFDLRTVKHFQLDRTVLQKWANILQWTAVPAVMLFMVLFIFIWQFIRALLFSLIGLIIGSIRGIRTEYSKLYVVTLAAGIPTALISALLSSVGIDFLGKGLILFIVSLFYLYRAVDSIDEIFDFERAPTLYK